VDFGELGKNIIKAAPLLGTLLGGPAGGVAGSLIAAKFGGDATKPDELLKRINSDPERDAKLAEIEANKEVNLQGLLVTAENNRLTNETSQLKIEADDRANARAANNQNQTPEQKWVDELIKVSIVLFLYGVVYGGLFWIKKSDLNPMEATTLNNVMVSAWTIILSIAAYYFGTSLSSKMKDIRLANKNNAAT